MKKHQYNYTSTSNLFVVILLRFLMPLAMIVMTTLTYRYDILTHTSVDIQEQIDVIIVRPSIQQNNGSR